MVDSEDPKRRGARCKRPKDAGRGSKQAVLIEERADCEAEAQAMREEERDDIPVVVDCVAIDGGVPLSSTCEVGEDQAGAP